MVIQTYKEMRAEVLGIIARACRDMARDIEEGHTGDVIDKDFAFIKAQMNRREVLEGEINTLRYRRREL